MDTIKPITKTEFAGSYWRRNPDLLFAAKDVVCPLSLFEVPHAIASMPLALVRDKDEFIISALLGLEDDINYFISPEGIWRGRYIPAVYRSYPFSLAKNEAQVDHYVLCFNQQSGLLSDEDTNDRFFEESGELSPTVKRISEFLKDVLVSRNYAKQLCALLDEFNLIKPWELKLQIGEDTRQIEGLYCFDEEAMNSLSDKKFLKLRQAGALNLAYCQMLSMQNVDELVRYAQAKLQLEAHTTQPSLADYNFDETTNHGNINFSNF
jgi:hypothetical protein